jgi:hypothetical protein
LVNPIGPTGAGNLKFTIYAPFVQKMHHIKFEKNWNCGYQEEVKKAKMLTDTIYVCPPLGWGGGDCYPEDYKFHNFGRGLLALHHHPFRFSSICAVIEKIFENWSILGSFCPAPNAPGKQGQCNSQFLFPFTHRCYKPNLVEIGSAVPEKKLKMFKSLRPTDE